MTFQLSDPVEAYISLVFAVSAVDDTFNPAEFQTSHTFLDGLPAFQRHNDEAIANFWIDMTRNFFEEFSNGGSLGRREAEDLIGAVKMVLPADQYEVAYAVTVQTAVADGLQTQEQQFLSQLRRGLNISEAEAESILAHVQGY